MKRSIFLVTLLAMMLLNFVKCGNMGAALGVFMTPGPSCRMASQLHCADYSREPVSDLPMYEAACPAFGGVWSQDGCPAPGPCSNGQQNLIECRM